MFYERKMARDSQIAADRGGGNGVELKLNLGPGVLYRTWSRPDRGLLAEITEPHREKGPEQKGE
jgi:hypothetical protein